LGLDALDILRIEAGLIFAGYEFCEQVDPYEAGIGFTVPLKTKEDDFVGRAALERRKASPQRTLVGLEQQHLVPILNGEIHSTSRFERPCFAKRSYARIVRSKLRALMTPI